MPFFVISVYNPKLKTYAIKVHFDDFDFDPTSRAIINKFKNMEHYLKTKNDRYKLYNNSATKQELIYQQNKLTKSLKSPIDIKNKMYEIINKIDDGSINEFLDNIQKKHKEKPSRQTLDLLQAIKNLIKFKNYKLLRNIGKSKEEIAEKLKKERDEAKGITEQQKERVIKIVQKLKQEDPKPKQFTDIIISLIKENENNRVIINRYLDAKEMKAIRNKLSRMKKAEELKN